MADKEIHYIRGKLFWAKVLGDPVDNYGKDGKEWTFDVSLDDNGLKQAKAIKLLNIKDKDDERGKFISFRQRYRELSPGKFTEAPRVMDASGNAWNQDEKLGNGTVADVKFEVRDYGKGKYPGIYPRAIRVLDHVPYASSEFAPLSSDDEFFGKASYTPTPEEDKQFKKDFLGHTADEDLDDEIPV